MIAKPEPMVPCSAFHTEATGRLAQMEKTGSGIPADEVFNYLRKRVQGKSAVRPRLRKVK